VERVLVLTPHEDRAGRATHLACELAERAGAAATLIRVLEEGPGSERQTSESGLSIREILMESETRRVEELAGRFRDRGVPVSVEVQWGVPGPTVVDLVKRDGFDLVVKPASGLGTQGRIFFGATALHLFRRCPCPVWVVGQEATLPSKIVAAVDPQRAPQEGGAATRILDWAERIAEWVDATVHVAAAWDAPAADLLESRLSSEDWKAYVEDAREHARENLAALLGSRSETIPAERVHLLQGGPTSVLPRFADEHDADLIVMGTLGREGRWGDLLGETAETIIRQIRCSALTIPPPGLGTA
jgi:nucleotide-binding universal stress UspA family protein